MVQNLTTNFESKFNRQVEKSKQDRENDLLLMKDGFDIKLADISE